MPKKTHKINEPGPAVGEEQEHKGCADFQHTLEATRARGEQLLKDLTAEIKQHPLRSMAVAVGLGYIIARLFGRGRNS